MFAVTNHFKGQDSMWTNTEIHLSSWADFRPEIDFGAARERIRDRIVRTPLLPLPSAPSGLSIQGKMENRQVTGSFKARGALNNLLQLSDSERAQGVVASSSGNHGQALAWAAKTCGVKAVIVMPDNAYPNKIDACRSHGADVVLAKNRLRADEIAKSLADSGKIWVHPYDRRGTVEGAGTVGLEVAEDAPNLDVFIACVGGGGLSAGSALALRRVFAGTGMRQPIIIGAEPEGAAAMDVALRAGRSIALDSITSHVQGLTTPYAGHINVAINSLALDAVITVPDEAIYEAQRILLNNQITNGTKVEVVEPAGAAAYAVAVAPWFPGRLESIMNVRKHDRVGAEDLRLAVTISGGNPDPTQLAALSG